MAFFWFAHHFNMANSPAMTHIKGVGGMEAYGQVNAFLELLVEVKNEFDVNNKMMMTVLMSRTMIKKLDKAQRFLDLILETDEFFKNPEGKISSKLISVSKSLNDKQIEGGKIGAKARKDKDKNLTNPQGNLEVTYDSLEDNTSTPHNKTEQQKNNTPHNNKADDKTEIKHYTDKIIYNEDVRKFRNKRFVELADKLPPSEVTEHINNEVASRFILEEGR
jgi:hypothetical protein